MNRRPRSRKTLPLPVAFSTASGVLVVSLWASGAPSMVYPLLADRWRVGEVVTTALFATYPVALVLALVACGSLSDSIGRRRVLLAGVGMVAVGTALFVITSGLVPIFIGRTLQGLGVGLAMSAASAALVEFAPRRTAALSTSVNTAATASGTALALVVGGALVQYSASPTTLPFAILLGVTIALLPLVWFLPEEATRSDVRWRPSRVRAPARNRVQFAIGVASLTVAFMMGAVFIGLGAQIVRDLVGTVDAFVAACALACWAVAVVPASVIARRGSPTSASSAGSVLSAAGSVTLVAAANVDLLTVFLLAAVVSGVGYGLMFYGGLGMVVAASEAQTRAATLSLMYLVAYLLQGLTAVGIGALATFWGLDRAIVVAMPTLATLSVASGVLVHWFARPRADVRLAS